MFGLKIFLVFAVVNLSWRCLSQEVREKTICPNRGYVDCRGLNRNPSIRVVDVIYGRVVGLNKCVIEPKVNCTAPAYCEVAEKSNRHSASYWLYPNDLKKDPCPRQNKYLIIKYKCLDWNDTLLGLVGDNFARDKPTSQSSQNALGGTPSKAVDGYTRNTPYTSCTATAKETNPWWRVDLGQHIAVSHVRIFNQYYDGIRLCGFEIRIGDSLENSGTTNARCGTLRHIPSNRDDVISCEPPLVGQYVTIVIPGDDRILTLCEVQVYGKTVGTVQAVTTQLATTKMTSSKPRTKSTTGSVPVVPTNANKQTTKAVTTQPATTEMTSSKPRTRSTTGSVPVVPTSANKQTTKAVTTQPAAQTIKPSPPRTISTTGSVPVVITTLNKATSEAITESFERETKDANGGRNAASGGSSSGALIGAAAGGGVLIIVLAVLIILVIIRQRRARSNNSIDEAEKRVTYQPSSSHVNDTPEQISLQDIPGPSAEHKPVVMGFKAASGDVYARPVKVKKKEAPSVQCDAYSNVEEVKEVEEEDSGILLSRFLIYVKDMKKSKNIAFQKEFKALPVGQSSSWDVAKKPTNADKNRYGNIVAYDHSRVVLSGGEDEDYINASFLSGIQPVNYIASQGPTEKTVDDFWRMIWEQDSNCIICLTNVSELGRVKCFQYWPDVETAFGKINVKPLQTELFADYVIRHLTMEKDGMSKKVSQYHFTSWPDHGVPKYPTQLLAFRRRIKALCSEGPQPIVVHCSAGVGRTGTFIALDIVLERLNKLGEQTINIFDTIKELRAQRVNMIQTVDQYIFLHDAVLEFVLCGITEIEAGNLRIEIERLEQKQLNKSLTGFEIEFNKLHSVCPSLSPEECEEASKKENKSKNRHPDIYPAESSRVVLRSRGYINATYVHGYTQALAYIATQTPLVDTINDFWMMVYEQKAAVIVMLNNLKEEKMDYPQYWPNEVNEEMQYGDLLVKMISSDTHGASISRKFSITNTNEKSCVAHVVRHVQFTAWSEVGVPSTHYNDVMAFLESVDEAEQRSENGVILVHCSNGAHRTGTYLALAIQRERMKTEHVLDVFRCIKLLRGQRPQFVGNVEQYKFCYEAMLNFVESYKTYDNLPKTIRDQR